MIFSHFFKVTEAFKAFQQLKVHFLIWEEWNGALLSCPGDTHKKALLEKKKSRRAHSIPPFRFPKAARGPSLKKCHFTVNELQSQVPLHTRMAADEVKDYSWPWLSIQDLINTILTEMTAVVSPLRQTPLFLLQAVCRSYSTLPKHLSHTFLLFSCKSFPEGSCAKAACQITASEKPWKHCHLSYLVPWNRIIHSLVPEMQM